MGTMFLRGYIIWLQQAVFISRKSKSNNLYNIFIKEKKFLSLHVLKL